MDAVEDDEGSDFRVWETGEDWYFGLTEWVGAICLLAALCKYSQFWILVDELTDII